MVNKNKSIEKKKKEAAIRYDTFTKEKMSKHDICVMADLIDEVNKRGYHIQYYFQLGFMDLKCRDLFPVIREHVWQFDDPEFSIRLLTYLGVPKLYEATPFLIESFKRKKQCRLGFSNSLETTRSAAASALLRIKDGRFQEEYRKLIADQETHDDSGLIVELLGHFDCPTNYIFLVDQLSDDNVNIKVSAIRALGRFKAHTGSLLEIFENIAEKSDNRDVVNAIRKSQQKLKKRRIYGYDEMEIVQ